MKDGYNQMPNEVLFSNLEPRAKLLYCHLSGLAKKRGYCWAKNKYLAEAHGITERSVRQYLTNLEEAGYIEIHDRANQNRKISVVAWKHSSGPGGTTVPGRVEAQFRAYKKEEEDKRKGKADDAATDSEDRVETAKTDGYILASALLALIRKNKKFYSRIARFFSPEKEEGSLCRWARDFDLLLTRDARDYDEAVAVLKWCQKDDFWQGQILSGDKFRKQYDTLVHAMNGGSTGNFGLPDENPEITSKLVEAYGWLINNSQWKPHKGQMPKFIEAAERVIAFIDLHNDRGLTVDELIGYLKSALQEAYREKGEMVHPGNMKSDYTWDVIMPQYLENVIGAL